MVKLNTDQAEALEKRQAQFQSFINDSNAYVADLLEAAGCREPDVVAANAEAALAFLDPWLSRLNFLNLPSEDQNWVRVSVGYLIGGVLMERYGGAWEVQADPVSDFFGEFVVGSFQRGIQSDILVSPARTAISYAREPLGRSLASTLAELAARARSQEHV